MCQVYQHQNYYAYLRLRISVQYALLMILDSTQNQGLIALRLLSFVEMS